MRLKLGQTHQNYFRNAEQEYSLFDQHLEVLLRDYQGDRLEMHYGYFDAFALA
jgi:hypothetical protein